MSLPEEYINDYFYRKVSTYVGDVITGFVLKESSILVNFTRDGKPLTHVATAIELIMDMNTRSRF